MITEAQKQKVREYRKTESYRASMRKYRQSEKGKASQKNRDERRKAKPQYCEYHRNYASAYYRRNKALGIPRKRADREKPQARFTELLWRSKKLGHEVSITFGMYLSLIQNPCTYCGGKMEAKGSGLDRVDSLLGYVDGNVTPCCKRCNRLKLDQLTKDETIAVVELLKKMRGTVDVWSEHRERRKTQKAGNAH